MHSSLSSALSSILKKYVPNGSIRCRLPPALEPFSGSVSHRVSVIPFYIFIYIYIFFVLLSTMMTTTTMDMVYAIKITVIFSWSYDHRGGDAGEDKSR